MVDSRCTPLHFRHLVALVLAAVLTAGAGGAVLSNSVKAVDRKQPARIDTALGPPPSTPLPEINWTDKVAEAELHAVYDRIRVALQRIYVGSGNTVAPVYQTWRRYNRVPYMSPAEGISFRNNYANERASAYGRPSVAGRFPVGAILAKDSFVVTEAGELLPGPFSLMEKMPAGFNPESRDWKFSQIEPDGSVLGTTGGQNAEKVLFCLGCHFMAGPGQDYVFFVPKEFRVP